MSEQGGYGPQPRKERAKSKAKAKTKAKLKLKPKPKTKHAPDRPQKLCKGITKSATSGKDAARKATMVRMRRWAKAAGYCNTAGTSIRPCDGAQYLVSRADAKRLMRADAPGAVAGGQDGLSPLLRAAVEEMKAAGAPADAVAETQSQADALLRNLVDEVVMRLALGGGALQVTAADVAAVVEPYRARMALRDLSMPAGLVDEARKKGFIGAPLVEKVVATVVP
jgi:hypothetical protein